MGDVRPTDPVVVAAVVIGAAAGGAVAKIVDAPGVAIVGAAAGVGLFAGWLATKFSR